MNTVVGILDWNEDDLRGHEDYPGDNITTPEDFRQSQIVEQFAQHHATAVKLRATPAGGVRVGGSCNVTCGMPSSHATLATGFSYFS